MRRYTEKRNYFWQYVRSLAFPVVAVVVGVAAGVLKHGKQGVWLIIPLVALFFGYRAIALLVHRRRFAGASVAIDFEAQRLVIHGIRPRTVTWATRSANTSTLNFDEVRKMTGPKRGLWCPGIVVHTRVGRFWIPSTFERFGQLIKDLRRVVRQ